MLLLNETIYLPFFLIVLGCSNPRSSVISIGPISLDNGDSTKLKLNVLYINAQIDCDFTSQDSVNNPIWLRSKSNLVYPKCPIFEFDSLNGTLTVNGVKFLDSTFDTKILNTIVLIHYEGELRNCSFPEGNSIANGYLNENDTLSIRTIMPFTSDIAFKIITSNQEIYIEQFIGVNKSNKLQIQYSNKMEGYDQRTPEEVYTYRYFNNIETTILRDFACL